MFKSNRRRRIFTNRRRSRRRFSWLGAIASIVLFLLVLELLTRIFVDLSGDRRRFARGAESNIPQAYRLNFVSDSTPATRDTNALTARSSVSVGYELIGGQKNEYWQINEQGFRDGDPVPLTKPKDEIRIFLLGGSTAFGYGNSSNAATISEQLEERLQQRLQQQLTSPQLYKPDVLPFDAKKKQKELAKPSKIKPGNYRTINAAVPGYASGNELAQLALQILKYKPDLIIVLNGYVDLMLPSAQKATQVTQFDSTEQQPSSFVEYLSQLIEPIENKSYLAKVAQNRWLISPQAEDKADFILNEQTGNLVQHLPKNEEELQKRVDRYIENQKQMLDLGAAARVPLIVAIQPEITGRNPSQLTDSEGKITTELGRTYIDRVRNSYPAFTKAATQLAKAFPKNMKAVDLYRLTDKYPSPSFVDAIHLNEAANQKVAEQLYYAISGFSKMQVVPKTPAPQPVSQ